MKIFSVIVTFNALRNDWLSKCLDSLLLSDVKTEIVVIDNFSSDNTCDFIKDNYPNITLITSEENLGFGKGNNLGISEALRNNADYILLLNQDTIIDANCIKLLLEASLKNEEYAIFSPIHLNYEGNDLEFYFASFMSSRNTPNFYYDHVINNKREIYETQFVNAAAWFIPAKIFLEIGGFDPIFKHYGEDNNYCQRVHYFQYKIGVVSNCYIYHDSRERKVCESYKYSEQFYSDYIKMLQVHYANINTTVPNNYKHETHTLLYDMFINLILLKFNVVKANLKKMKLLNKSFHAIYKSRQINSLPGRHYLY